MHMNTPETFLPPDVPALSPASLPGPKAAQAHLLAELDAFKHQLAAYLRADDIAAAYHFSASAHEGQFRKSGEPYVSHPWRWPGIVADWHLDPQALIAALLHDVMEDTHISKQDDRRAFRQDRGRTGRWPLQARQDGVPLQEEAQAENFRKMLLAMASDLRVILIKLADRLHNMRTLGCVRPDKRRRIARETLEIYAPIANRLGLNTLLPRVAGTGSFEHNPPPALSRAGQRRSRRRAAIAAKSSAR
jgi:GTP diphosphokinase / guanosine-3',5'-bis(diphosphate) 3'-diphosphatase